MDHNENRKKDKHLWNLYKVAVNEFLKSCEVDFDDQEIDRAVGLLWTNSFASNQGGGQAIYPVFSLVSHSCKPNCTQSVFPNKTLALQAKVNIEAGEEFTISYISTVQGISKRKTKLREKWFFECTCQRCIDSTECGSHCSTLLCQKCSVPEAFVLCKEPNIPESSWECTICDSQITFKEVFELENRIANEMQKIGNTDIIAFETFLQRVGSKLHQNHYLMILLKRHLVGLYSSNFKNLSTSCLEQVQKYAESLVSFYEIIDPGYQKERGTILRTLCEVKKLLAQRKLTTGTITEVQFQENVKDCVNLFQEAQKCLFVRHDFFSKEKKT